MDQADPARDLDLLRRLAEAALARQDTAQRQRADDQAAVDRDQAAQAETADHTQTLAEAQQLAAEVFGTEDARTGVRSFLEHGLGEAKFAGR